MLYAHLSIRIRKVSRDRSALSYGTRLGVRSENLLQCPENPFSEPFLLLRVLSYDPLGVCPTRGALDNQTGTACRPCRACRIAAVRFSAETTCGSRRGRCNEISGEILLFLFPQEMKLESAKISQQISHHFSPDNLQLQRTIIGVFTLRTFVLEACYIFLIPASFWCNLLHVRAW